MKLNVRLKNQYLYIILLFISICMILASLIISLNVYENRKYIYDDRYENSVIIQKNLNQYVDKVGNLIIDYKYYNDSYNYYDEKLNKINSSETIELIADEYKDYNSVKKYIEDRTDIQYYILDKVNEKSYTNIKNVRDIGEYIRANSLYTVKIYEKYKDYHIGYERYHIDTSKFKKNNMEGYFIINKNIKGELYEEIKRIDSIRNNLIKKFTLSILLITVGLIVMICLIKNKKTGVSITIKKLLNKYEKVPLDIRIAILVIYTIVVIIIMNIAHSLDYSIESGHPLRAIFISIYIIYFLMNIRYLKKIPYKYDINFKDELKNDFIHTKIIDIEEIFESKSILTKIAYIGVLTVLFGAALTIVTLALSKNIYNDFSIILIIYIAIYMLVIPKYILKKTNYFKYIMKGIEEIKKGNLDYEIKEDGSGILVDIANDINHMKDGLRKALEKQMKSERLKTELITNVSHDLKTPLTSIINYVNLLKNEELSKDDIRKYTGVLDKKSQRLKILIEDLFEISKLSSGEMELKIERVDIVALLNQALGELEEKIDKSSLIFKTNIWSNNIYLELDGNKIWRVFENLINNILKYSQPHTRVYIDIIDEKEKIIVTMKNTSAYELNFNVGDIFERFKRGDESRNTEGSGLGLAIAKSIVDMHGGKLSIDVDADLFKVLIEFYKNKEEAIVETSN